MNTLARLTADALTFGNLQLPEGSEERPLVTFALFAYNQELYIREAVLGALSQTYQPLEIVLSDDFSSYKTFEIIKEIAESYQGPHRVICSRNKENLGLVDHACRISAISSGQLFVLAAGDDISLPDRTEEIVAAYKAGFNSIFSSCNLIDSNGELLLSGWMPTGSSKARLPWVKVPSSDFFVYGASSAYDARVFRRLPPAHCRVLSEDTPLNTLLQAAGGKIFFIDKPLVDYRVHELSLSNSAVGPVNLQGLRSMEARQAHSLSRSRDILLYIRNKLVADPVLRPRLDKKILDNIIKVHNSKIRWYQARGLQRMLSSFKGLLRAPKWHLLRLFGEEPYFFLKLLHITLAERDSRYKP
jgi:glycosyltransferase involved in cell wall biosynthesis